MGGKDTKILAGDAGGIAKAVELLRNGELVAFPTETVYGLGGNARSSGAVKSIFAAKGRPSFNPLIAHVASFEEAQEIADFDDISQELAARFWPGPLTLVVPLRPNAGIAPEVSAGLSTVALRVPTHPLAQNLLKASGLVLAAPSANPSGRVSPTQAQHVFDGLNGKIAAILDGGPCPVGLESSIIAAPGVVDERPTLLRPGGLAHEEIEAHLGQNLQRLNTEEPSSRPNAPGQLASHYAPRARLRLNALSLSQGEILLGFGEVEEAAKNLSPSGDLNEAAANLFSHLRQLDNSGAETIAVSPIPETGLGLAINDRLRRAAAPR